MEVCVQLTPTGSLCDGPFLMATHREGEQVSRVGADMVSSFVCQAGTDC